MTPTPQAAREQRARELANTLNGQEASQFDSYEELITAQSKLIMEHDASTEQAVLEDTKEKCCDKCRKVLEQGQ